jgi:hypothetical protein
MRRITGALGIVGGLVKKRFVESIVRVLTNRAGGDEKTYMYPPGYVKNFLLASARG